MRLHSPDPARRNEKKKRGEVMVLLGEGAAGPADAVGDLIRLVPQRFSLILDIDGTMLDIAAGPDQVIVPPTLVRDLMALEQGLGGAVAVLTGRPFRDADRMLAPLRLAGAGGHGAELRAARDGAVEVRSSGPSPALRGAIARAVSCFANAGVVVEEKTASIAVHVRAAPQLEERVVEVMEGLRAGSGEELRLERGRRVIELLPAKISKGRGLSELMELSPFRGRRPVMIGDDVSDEAAFGIVKEAGGFALPVAGERFSAEDAVFASPQDVRRWLSLLAEVL